MYRHLCLLPIAMLFCFAGCHLLDEGIPGSGTIASENREVGDFSGVGYSGGGTVQVVIGDTTSVEIECDDNLLEHIVTEVKNGQLKIYPAKSISPTTGINVKITTPSLSKLSIAGSGEGSVVGLDEAKLAIDIAGSGKVKCNGSAESLAISIAGSGEVVNDELASRKVDVSIAGSGDVRVQATDELSVSIAGSGKVQYIGSPKVAQKIAGSGEVVEIKAENKAEKD